MSLFKKMLFGGLNPHPLADENNRKQELIRTITLELLILGLILTGLNLALHFWFISAILTLGTFISAFSLILLRKNYNLQVCGHIINSLCLCIIVIGNLWLGGLQTSYINWFYVSPIIAAVTLGLDGLVIYSFLSATIIGLFIYCDFTAFYSLPAHYITLLSNLNHIFIFALIVTILYNLLAENKQYESLLREQNFLLYADKQKFHYLSHHDSLTNLPNRSYFHSYLQSVIDSLDTEQSSVTVYFMDLDGFKKINDKYGHETGDMFLLQTSKRLHSCFRERDFIARLGGDEFTAIISHHPKDNIAETVLQRIKKEFKAPYIINGLSIHSSISVGLASYPEDALDAERLLKIADEAMYKNKKRKSARGIASGQTFQSLSTPSSS